MEHTNTVSWECWWCRRVTEAAGWGAGGQTEHRGPDCSVRLKHIWILFFRNEGPNKAFDQGCGMTKAAVLRVIFTDQCWWIRREKKGMDVGGPGQTLWKPSRYELRADLGVGRKKGRGSHGHCYERRIGRK